MVEKGLDDLVEKYTQDDAPPWVERTVSTTARISVLSRLKLEILSQHVGIRKTPLIGEIAEAAINDLFDRLFEEMDDNLKEAYATELQHMEESH